MEIRPLNNIIRSNYQLHLAYTPDAQHIQPILNPSLVSNMNFSMYDGIREGISF